MRRDRSPQVARQQDRAKQRGARHCIQDRAGEQQNAEIARNFAAAEPSCAPVSTTIGSTSSFIVASISMNAMTSPLIAHPIQYEVFR